MKWNPKYQVVLFKTIKIVLRVFFVVSRFAIVTFFLIIYLSVLECSCLKDVIYLSNSETFFMKIFFATLSALFFLRRIKSNDCLKVPSSSNNLSVHMNNCSLIHTMSILDLPIFDFIENLVIIKKIHL